MDTGYRMANRVWAVSLCVIGLSLAPEAAWGYVGPGAGLSVIGSILALVVAVVLGVVGFIWYPIRRLRRAMRARHRAP
jgi:uncharacterized membrane protein